MRIVFRADASTEIGSGHVMRCLALADELKRQGAATQFICREHHGHLFDLIEAKGHGLSRLPATPADSRADVEQSARIAAASDWMVVDHYGLDAGWESVLRTQVRRILVIDDLADRRHDCDLLLDQNCQPAVHARYASLLPGNCRTLLGPRFALLRPQFAAHRAHLPKRDGSVRRILIFFGGTDPGGETLKALAAVARLKRADISVDVVIGQANPQRAAIESACRELPQAHLHCQVDDMATLMGAADLAIGAGGSATWERCCLGLPSLVIGIADNQVAPAAALAEAGGQLYIGASGQVSVEHLAQAIANAIALPELLVHLACRGMELVDGCGASRVSNRLLADQIWLRPALPADSELIHRWRNHPDIRAQSFVAAPISREDHEHWYAGTLANPARILLIGEQAGKPVGVLRYDLSADSSGMTVVSLYLVPGQAGQGYGTRLLLAGNRWLAENHPEATRLEASVRAGNAASAGAFLAAGFTLHHSVYRKEPDVPP